MRKKYTFVSYTNLVNLHCPLMVSGFRFRGCVPSKRISTSPVPRARKSRSNRGPVPAISWNSGFADIKIIHSNINVTKEVKFVGLHAQISSTTEPAIRAIRSPIKKNYTVPDYVSTKLNLKDPDTGGEGVVGSFRYENYNFFFFLLVYGFHRLFRWKNNSC